jgi:hypothetical protein
MNMARLTTTQKTWTRSQAFDRIEAIDDILRDRPSLRARFSREEIAAVETERGELVELVENWDFNA